MKGQYPAIKCEWCHHERTGANWNIWKIDSGGVDGLREMFPKAKADEMNFVLFSTSGIHGSYARIEDIERSLTKYGENPEFAREGNVSTMPDDYWPPNLTVSVYHPRIIGIGYGVIRVTLEDISFLKKLRKSSWQAVQKIGAARPRRRRRIN